MTLAERLASALERSGAVGAVAGVSVRGRREVAAAGLADAETRAALAPTARLPVASLTKPIVATAAVRAWRARGIDLATPVIDLVTGLRPDWRASPRISLRHLLSHTSGLRADVPPDELARFSDAADGLERAARATVHHGQTYRLGTAWRYSNAGYGLAGHALGVVAGPGFDEALGDALLAAAGMTSTSFAAPDGVGHRDGRPLRETYWRARRPGGGLVSTVDDLLAFAEFAYRDAWSWAATGEPVAPSLLGTRYGLGWNIGGPVRWHTGDWGGCHSALLVAPAAEVAVAVVVNDDAGTRVRRDVAWAELARVTGLRRPRLRPILWYAHAAGRSLVASVRSVAG